MKATDRKDEIELDTMAEQEFARLQQHYRILESNQGNISDKTKLLLNKQRSVINSLMEEKEELLLQLRICSSKRYEAKDNEANEKLTSLMEIHSKCVEYIKTEKAQLKELECQIRKVEKEVIQLRSKQDTHDGVLSRATAKERNIRILEGRLHNENVKFNQQVADNAVLRDQINHLLKERSHFNMLYQALMGKFNHNKKVLMDLVEQATHAYDQREEYQNKLAILKERGRMDLVTQSTEMRELKRRFDHDSKLQEFLAVKGQRRLMIDLDQKEATRKRLYMEALDRQLEHYKQTLERVCKFSGETDIDKLSSQFIKQEEENFALFNYVYELNNELEALHEQVTELRSSIDEQAGLSEKREQQQKYRLEGLREELQKATDDAKVAEEQLLGWTALRNKLLEGIEKLFDLIKCEKSPLLELLGGNTHVTPFNMMLYLGLIERRCIELVTRCSSVEKKSKKHDMPLPLQTFITDYDKFPNTEPVPTIDTMVPGQPCALYIWKLLPILLPSVRPPVHGEELPRLDKGVGCKRDHYQIEVLSPDGLKYDPGCVEQDEVGAVGDAIVSPMTREEVREALITKMGTPGMDIDDRVHNIASCRLPRSRRVLIKLNQEK